VFGANAEHARLREVSGLEDPHLIPLLQELREEARRPSTSRLFSGRNNTGVPGPSRYGRICFVASAARLGYGATLIWPVTLCGSAKNGRCPFTLTIKATCTISGRRIFRNTSPITSFL
jgi:hypothetical protein